MNPKSQHCTRYTRNGTFSQLIAKRMQFSTSLEKHSVLCLFIMHVKSAFSVLEVAVRGWYSEAKDELSNLSLI